MRLFSAIRPSGIITIANYLGAIKQWVELQESYEAYFAIADLHAITTPYDPKTFPQTIRETLAIYLALGLDPEKATIFLQSDAPEHPELAWLFQTFMPVGEFERMTQYKDKVKEGAPAHAGLLTYPALMAADILLYKPDVVPVGEDQTQHVEFTREIARRFNKRFGEVFPLPKTLLATQHGAERVLSLRDTAKKMSKSHHPDSYISFTDSPDEVRRKLRSAVTDSGTEIAYDPKKKPAISNLLIIASGVSGKTIQDLAQELSGKGYADFKMAVADMIIEKLTPIQTKFRDLVASPATLQDVLAKGRGKAKVFASQTLTEVKQKMGLSEGLI
ncbi:MAG: tryptophan--tRNA ligase [Parcubacteria group bacterium]|nr:tryptophan--tRNA ligase [Parcubacteria group bacterium]